MLKYSKKIIQEIIKLRKAGRSIPEIETITKVPRATVWRYTKDLNLNKNALKRIKKRKGRSKEKSLERRLLSKKAAKNLLKESLSKKERFILLLGLYWGEGTKRELSFINSDPKMLKSFIVLLRDMGITSDRIVLTIRLHEGVDKKEAVNFWLSTLGFSKKHLQSVYVIPAGNKSNLEYGMCRVRVKKNIDEFLLIMSGIEKIGEMLNTR